MSDILKQIMTNLYDGNNKAIGELVQQALDEGLSATEILNDGLIAGMDIVGRDFKSGELFIPEVLVTARAMHTGLDVLRPRLVADNATSAGKFMIGTVKGDLHDIGKNLVKMMMEGAGFEIIDLGTNVSAAAFVDAVRDKQPDVVGMSALLTTTMTEMKATVDALVAAGLRDKVKIMIGGAPVTEGFAQEIGADAYSADAATAVDTARALVQ